MTNEQKIAEIMQKIQDFDEKIFTSEQEFSVKECKEKISKNQKFISLINAITELKELDCDMKLYRVFTYNYSEVVSIKIMILEDLIVIKVYNLRNSDDTNILEVIKNHVIQANKELEQRIEYLQQPYTGNAEVV